MSSLDNVINQTKKFANIASKKASNVLEISKMKIEKVNKGADLQKNYELLGRLCYQELLPNYESASDDIKNIIEKINSLEAEISNIEKDISLMKKIKTCPVCGCKNNKNAIFCSKCGARITPQTQDNLSTDSNIAPAQENINSQENNENLEDHIYLDKGNINLEKNSKLPKDKKELK